MGLNSKLDVQQSHRLYVAVNECRKNRRLSLRDLVKVTGVSLGRLGMLNPDISSYGPCTKGIAFQICEGLGINFYYVVENKHPKYINWREAFSGK